MFCNYNPIQGMKSDLWILLSTTSTSTGSKSFIWNPIRHSQYPELGRRSAGWLLSVALGLSLVQIGFIFQCTISNWQSASSHSIHIRKGFTFPSCWNARVTLALQPLHPMISQPHMWMHYRTLMCGWHSLPDKQWYVSTYINRHGPN